MTVNEKYQLITRVSIMQYDSVDKEKLVDSCIVLSLKNELFCQIIKSSKEKIHHNKEKKEYVKILGIDSYIQSKKVGKYDKVLLKSSTD